MSNSGNTKPIEGEDLKNSFPTTVCGRRRLRKIFFHTDFQYESVRCETFWAYPSENNTKLMELARKGFFYDRNRNLIFCYFCNKIISPNENWKAVDYHKYCRNCPMNQLPLCGNIPLIDPLLDIKDEIIDKINTKLQECMTFRTYKTIPDEKSNLFYYGKLIILIF
ncbi:UNVERIFIED_CONTAM: hypothetical protein RMT77_019824 [Armadillidium vulgare]